MKSLGSLWVMSTSAGRSAGVLSHVSASQRHCELMKMSSCFLFVFLVFEKNGRIWERRGLTGFQLSEAVPALLSYTVDPARDGKTNSQHIPYAQGRDDRDTINLVNRLGQEVCTELKMATRLFGVAAKFKKVRNICVNTCKRKTNIRNHSNNGACYLQQFHRLVISNMAHTLMS